jgi:8-oxo-dGTP pyrophosphatase MutT (NUDIX family)
MSTPPRAPGPAAPLSPWEVTASEHVLDSRWLKVRADACVTSDGAVIAPFYVLEYPDWVHVVAIDDDDNLILVEQYRHGLGKASLELPAGAIDPTDSGPLEAAARELKEETGYVAQLLSETLVMSPNPATHNNRFHVVLARGVTRRHAPLQDPTERLNVIRVPIREVVRRLVRGDMLHSMHVASLAVALTSIGRWER